MNMDATKNALGSIPEAGPARKIQFGLQVEF